MPDSFHDSPYPSAVPATTRIVTESWPAASRQPRTGAPLRHHAHKNRPPGLTTAARRSPASSACAARREPSAHNQRCDTSPPTACGPGVDRWRFLGQATTAIGDRRIGRRTGTRPDPGDHRDRTAPPSARPPGRRTRVGALLTTPPPAAIAAPITARASGHCEIMAPACTYQQAVIFSRRRHAERDNTCCAAPPTASPPAATASTSSSTPMSPPSWIWATSSTAHTDVDHRHAVASAPLGLPRHLWPHPTPPVPRCRTRPADQCRPHRRTCRPQVLRPPGKRWRTYRCATHDPGPEPRHRQIRSHQTPHQPPAPTTRRGPALPARPNSMLALDFDTKHHSQAVVDDDSPAR